jgi:hypothetical protein
MGATTASIDSAISKVKAWQPSALRVTLIDGEVKDVAVPIRKRKWQAIRSVLEGLDWVKFEALDKKGQIVGVYEAPEAKQVAAVTEEDDAGDVAEDAFFVAVRRQTSLMLRAQDVALKRQSETQGQLLDQAVALLKVLTERTINLEKMYASNLTLVQELSMGGPEEEPMQSDALLKALAPAMAKRLIGAGNKRPSNKKGSQ